MSRTPHAGDIVPAYGIVIGRNELEINETMLTGETVLKHKTPQYLLEGDAVKSGQTKSGQTLFAGTYVQAGDVRAHDRARRHGRQGGVPGPGGGEDEGGGVLPQHHPEEAGRKLDAKTTPSPTWACTAASYSSSSCACEWPVLHGACCIEVCAPSFRPARQQRIPRTVL